MLRLQEIKFLMTCKISIFPTRDLLVSLMKNLKKMTIKILKKKIVREANDGWLGITDKYWITAIVPEKGENFKSTFLYKDAYKANYILNNPKTISPSSSQENSVRLFVAAKEVETIDTYAEKQGIEKFDLVIDWGWFYFLQNPFSS